MITTFTFMLAVKKKRSWYDTHFSLFEMHTDKSTNCTLLGPVDCDSFYKWIPLNRWPVAISSEVLHFIYCAFLSVSICTMCSSLFLHLSLGKHGAGSNVWVWRGGLFEVFFQKLINTTDKKDRRLPDITRILIILWLFMKESFIYGLPTHILPVLQFFFPPSFRHFEMFPS